MSKRCKVSRKKFFLAVTALLILIITFRIPAKGKGFHYFFKSLTTDTLPASGKDTLVKKDTLVPAKKDSLLKEEESPSINFINKDTAQKIHVDTLLLSKDSLDAPISYAAQDSGVLVIPTKQFFLYGKANAKHQDMQLDAGVITYDQQTQFITAYGGADTTNSPLNKAKITQAGAESISDTIKFNMKNQKGITKNTFYKEGEIFVHADKVKKIDKNIAYALRGRFTTCNLDTPHFDFRTKRLKLINDKIAVSGPAYPEFEGVPLPVAIPFGIFPLQRGRHSGMLPPSFLCRMMAWVLGWKGWAIIK